MLRLVGVTPDNWRCPLAVAPEQKEFVADRVLLLARAYAYRAVRSHAVFRVAGKTGAGMALWRNCGQENAYILDDLFIDARYQGRGYGTAALALILEGLRREGKFPRVILRYVEGNDAARKFYERSGFRRNFHDFEDEIEMELTL